MHSIVRRLLRVIFLVVVTTAHCQGDKKKMHTLHFTKGFEEGSQDFPEIAIHAAEKQALSAPASPLPMSGYYRPFANDEQNSRLDIRLPDGTWAVQWNAELSPQQTPTYVLGSEDRIMVLSDLWTLFDSNGKQIAEGQTAGGPLVLDPTHKLFYHILPSGYLSGVHLSDGQPEFLFPLALGDLYSRDYIARHGARILVTAIERAMNPHDSQGPSKSILEVNDIGDPVKTSSGHRVTGSQAIGELEIPSLQLITASHRDWIVSASKDVVYVTTWDLQGHAALTASFQPRRMSLDENGRIYLIAEQDGMTQLWLLTQAGERLYSFEFSGGTLLAPLPPIIAHDHTAYIIEGRSIYAIGENGKLRWIRESPALIRGATMTADDQLLVSQGKQLVAWDKNGASKLLYSFEEELLTPPVLTSPNALLVASKKKLYSLSTTHKDQGVAMPSQKSDATRAELADKRVPDAE